MVIKAGVMLASGAFAIKLTAEIVLQAGIDTIIELCALVVFAWGVGWRL